VKYDLMFNPPIMNAAGMLGFTLDAYGPIGIARLGVFITNPVSLGPRTPAQAERYQAYPGGFLLHTGHANPGLKAVIRRYAPRWERSSRPVIVHLLCQGTEDAVEMVRRLEGLAGVAGFEVGLPAQVEVQPACALLRAVQGELPLIVRLPLDRAMELGTLIAAALPELTFSLGPPRGALARPEGGIVHGRLYGPSLFPQTLEALRSLVKAGLRVIAGCGVYHPRQVDLLLSAGAVGVQLDTVLWRGGFWKGEPTG
jgi:dihydroorotate dehydrogenase (NAD+) catalytic subunit